MSDYSFNFSTQTTASPWTVPSPLIKLSTQNLAITNGSGVRSSANGNNAWLGHNVAYTGGSTAIQSDITVPSWVLNGDLVGPGIFARSGANAGNGYAVRVDGGGAMYIDKVTGGNFTTTQLTSVGSITLNATDTISISYVQSTGVISAMQNGVSKVTVTDTTFASDTTLAPGVWTSPGNTNSQYVKTFAGTGVAAGGAATLSSPTPSGTIGTSNSVVVGCTTDTVAGTLYAVIDTAANITGITAAQVIAGQNKNTVAALSSGNIAVTGLTMTLTLSGLSPNTTYSYALAQNNGSNSNVVTGSFTTSQPSPLVQGARQTFVTETIIQF